MAKKKNESSMDDFFSSMAKATGGDVLNEIDSVKYFIDSGNLAINYICSGRFIDGGIPGGKLTEIYGPSSSSKSLVGSNVLYGCQKINGIPILLDCENSANKEFIKKASHCDLKRVLRYTPQTLEDVFKQKYTSIDYIRKAEGKDIPIAIVYDSISVSPCAREFREIKLPDGYTEADFKRIVGAHEQPGERAKICSRELRKLNTVMEKNNATVVILNQTRNKIGTYGNPETTGGGGAALEFYASCRLRTQTLKKIEEKISSKSTRTLGVYVRVQNRKNKTHRPFISTDNVQLLFEHGINPVSGLLTCLLDCRKIEAKSAGNFTVNPKLTDGKEINFKASVDRNDVPIEILLKCPALIDATTEQEVSDYLAPFHNAINFNPSKDVVETEVRSEDEEDLRLDEELN